MALPVPNRIKKAADLRRIFREGRPIRGTFLFLRYLCRDSGSPRAAIIIPARVFQGAAERNRVRRVISSVIEKGLPTVRSGCDMIFVVQQVPTDEKEYRQETERLLTLLSHTT